MGKNTLSYLLTTETVIRDEITKKPSYIGIFEGLVIPKNQERLIYSFVVVGKILNADAGLLNMKVKIIAPDNKIFRENLLSGVVNAGDVDISSRFSLSEFLTDGRYKLKVSINNKDCEDGDRFYFDVIKQQ